MKMIKSFRETYYAIREGVFGGTLFLPSTSRIRSICPFLGDVSHVTEEERRHRTPLHERFFAMNEVLVHKWLHYLPIYERFLSRYVNSDVKLLEIGVSQGGSLKLWRQYLGERARITGIDIDGACARFDGLHGQVRIGSQADAAFLRRVVSEMDGVDVVIDDGSHIATHQSASLETLLPLISPRGMYICEDLHTSYWPGPYKGGYRRHSAFIEVAKRLVDDLHADFHERGEETDGVSRSVEGIHFFNSMVVITKAPMSRPSHVMVGP